MFHQHPFFEKIQQKIHEPFKNTFQKYGIGRYWFGIHVIVELILDKYLIKNNLTFLDKLYSDVEFSIQSDRNWMKTIEHNNPSQFISSMNKFCEFKFLHKYTEVGGTMIGLNKIYQFVKADTKEWRENKDLWKELILLEDIVYDEVANNYKLLQNNI